MGPHLSQCIAESLGRDATSDCKYACKGTRAAKPSRRPQSWGTASPVGDPRVPGTTPLHTARTAHGLQITSQAGICIMTCSPMVPVKDLDVCPGAVIHQFSWLITSGLYRNSGNQQLTGQDLIYHIVTGVHLTLSIDSRLRQSTLQPVPLGGCDHA